MEETGICVQNPTNLKTFAIVSPKGKNMWFHTFEAKFTNKPDVILNEEHTEYKWLCIEDVFKLDLIHDERECYE